MPILAIQRRLRELGRIRLGEVVQPEGKRARPVRLEKFRVTSASKALVESVAEHYGGDVAEWKSPSGAEWQVRTTASELPILIPPTGFLDQWFELWSAGGCKRRCDGETEVIQMRPCLCPRLDTGEPDPATRQKLAAKGQACSPHTRLWVMLPEVPGIGTWRLETGSWYAAEELAGVAALLATASARNESIPAVLRIEQRVRKTPEGTRRFSVPVIDAAISPATLIGQPPALTPPVDPPLPGRRGTERVPIGPTTPAPSTRLDARAPEHGPAPSASSPPDPAVIIERERARKLLTALVGEDRNVQLRWLRDNVAALYNRGIATWDADDWAEVAGTVDNELVARADSHRSQAADATPTDSEDHATAEDSGPSWDEIMGEAAPAAKGPYDEP